MSPDSGQDAELEKEARKVEIEAERASFMEPGKSRGDFLSDYLVNIENVMPIPPGHEDVDSMGMNKRIAIAMLGLMDKKCREMPYFHEGENSELLLNQTPREVFATIDKALAEVGVDIAEIGQLQHDMISGNFDQGRRSKRRILDLVEPAFIRLREIGYKRHDLVT